MKRVEAMVRPAKLDEIKEALSNIGISGMTISEIKGFGRTGGKREVYRGSAYVVDFVPKVKIEIVAPDDLVEDIVQAVQKSGSTGRSATERSSSTTWPRRSGSGPGSAGRTRSSACRPRPPSAGTSYCHRLPTLLEATSTAVH